MAEMNWEGYLSYRAPALGHRDYVLYLIPVSFFSVSGGIKRTIDLTIPQEAGLIISELSEAKTFKNLRVFAEETENLMWRFDLWEIRARGLSVDFEFAIQSKIDKKLVSGHRFVALNARIKDLGEQHSNDSTTGKRFLPFRFEFQSAAILQGFVHYSPFLRIN